MIELYKRTETAGRLRLLVRFETFDDLFLGMRESDFAAFGYADDDRAPKQRLYAMPFDATVSWLNTTQYVYVAMENGRIITPDRLLGLYRQWRAARTTYFDRYYRRRRDTGQRKPVYGGYRYPRTTQERRHACSVDDGEPKVRSRRNAANLADAWDDVIRHTEKSWKRQSKRRRQWKEKR